MAYRQLALIEARKHDNQQKYIEFLKQAYQLGDKGSQMLLAVNALEEDDKLTALMLVEEVAQQDYAWAQAQLGQWYFDGNVASRIGKRRFIGLIKLMPIPKYTIRMAFIRLHEDSLDR